ncbi:MAG: hypothetical protein AB7T37_15995 [Dehalococcoidia bacterium]
MNVPTNPAFPEDPAMGPDRVTDSGWLCDELERIGVRDPVGTIAKFGAQVLSEACEAFWDGEFDSALDPVAAMLGRLKNGQPVKSQRRPRGPARYG